MRIFLLLTFLTSLSSLTKAQKVDSIYFHLYTDSLKKGTFNYINVDGKLSDGRWLPLSTKELEFSSNAGKFSGNSLFIDSSFREPKVTIKAVLKQNPSMWREVTIFIKTTAETERLKTVDELMEGWKKDGKSKDKKKSKG